MTLGILYVLENSSLPGQVKIGRTTRDASSRAAELSDASGVPTPFAVALEVAVTDCVLAERRIHDALREHRTSESREFFRVSTREAALRIAAVCADLILYQGRTYKKALCPKCRGAASPVGRVFVCASGHISQPESTIFFPRPRSVACPKCLVPTLVEMEAAYCVNGHLVSD